MAQFRLFSRKGRIPRRFRREFKTDTPLFSEEKLPGKLLIQTLSGPGGHVTCTTEAFTACIAVNSRRFLLATSTGRLLNLPLDETDDLRWQRLHVRTPMPQLLAISYDALNLEEGWAGLWEFRLNLDNAKEIMAALHQLGMQKGSADKR